MFPTMRESLDALMKETNIQNLILLREFQTEADIIAFVKTHKGRELFEVMSIFSKPNESRRTIIVDGIIHSKTFEGRESPSYFFNVECGGFKGYKYTTDRFVSDLQNIPGKAVFSVQEKADVYLAKATEVFRNSVTWMRIYADAEYESKARDSIKYRR